MQFINIQDDLYGFENTRWKLYCSFQDNLNSERVCTSTSFKRVLWHENKQFQIVFCVFSGYYSLDTEKIRHDMRVGDRIVDTDTLGVYINKECENFAIYKLEKIVGGGKFVFFLQNSELRI